jgi:hypothetical protein
MLLKRAFLMMPKDSTNGMRVGFNGGLIGVLRITSLDVFNAVTRLLHNGRRVNIAKKINNR